MERLSNVWMKMTRGDIAARFDKIKDTYLDVQKDTKNQIEKERLILEAYMDFRGALKNSEVLALDVLKTAEGKLEEAKTRDEGGVRRGCGLHRHGAGGALQARARAR